MPSVMSAARIASGLFYSLAMKGAPLASVPLLLLTVGCGDLGLGQAPGLVFWAGAEPGDISEWTAGSGGITFVQGQGQVEVVNAPVRRGAHAFRTIINDTGGTLTQATLFRGGPFPTDAYYSAWFRLAEAHATSYWAILKIQSLTSAADSAPTNVWDLALQSEDGTTLTMFLSDRRTDTMVARSPAPVPVGRWFHVEMFLRAATDATGRIEVWLDGATAMTVEAYPTAPTTFLAFGVGNIATTITPTVATIDIDDVAISTQRLGP
jgi:hypothetical protein